MMRIAKEIGHLTSTLRGEIGFLLEFLKESGAVLDVKKAPRASLSQEDQIELKKVLDVLKQAVDGKQESASVKIVESGRRFDHFIRKANQEAVHLG